MTMTDPIADMLTRIRNANIAMHDDVRMPSSKVKEALAGVLAAEGYIHGFEGEENPGKPGRTLHVRMKYSPDRARTISGIKRVSKPGLRVYSPSTKVPRVLGGLGVAVLSTSQGLLSDREARKRKVGGEVSLAGRHITVRGPKGTLERDIPGNITVRQDGDELVVERPNDERQNRA